MLSTTMHQVLTDASMSFGPSVFSLLGFHERAEAAIDKSDKWQKRNRALNAMVVLFFVVFMSLHRSSGIKNVLRKLFSLLREKSEGLSLTAVTPEAICHARKRLGIEPLKVLFEDLAAAVEAAPSFHGLRVRGYDGVRFTLPDTPTNVKAFGRPKAARGRSAFPQMLAVALVDTQTHNVRDVAMGRCTDSERVLARKFVQHLGPQDLLLMDRGCSGVSQFETFMNQQCHVLGRVSASWKPQKLRQLGPGDWLVRVEAYEETEAQRKKTKKARRNAKKQKRRGQRRTRRKTGSAPKRRLISLEMRMIEYQIDGGESCRLLTDLLDSEEFPARELAIEYHSRWECELTYDELKTHLATVTHGTLHTVFRSKSPEGVIQEAYGTFIAYNLIRQLMVEAGKAHGIPPLEISFVDTVEVVKLAAPRFEAASRRRHPQLAQQLLEDIALCRNKRPRRHRWNPRVVKIKMTNFALKRRHHRGKTVDFAATLRVKSSRLPSRVAA